MRRDCVTQVIVRWRDGEEDNFATPFEAENYINWALDELGEPEAAWLEDMQGRKKWDYRLVEDEGHAAVDDAASHDHLRKAAPRVAVEPLFGGEHLAHRGDHIGAVVVDLVTCHSEFPPIPYIV